MGATGNVDDTGDKATLEDIMMHVFGIMVFHPVNQFLAGNIAFLGGFREPLVIIAVRPEELVDRMEDHYPAEAQANIVERAFISGVTEIVGGAHPSSMPPAYGWDMKAFKAYTDAAKDPGDWATVSDRFVASDEQTYLAGFGGVEAVKALPLPIF